MEKYMFLNITLWHYVGWALLFHPLTFFLNIYYNQESGEIYVSNWVDNNEVIYRSMQTSRERWVGCTGGARGQAGAMPPHITANFF
jgi:hypothetical protein